MCKGKKRFVCRIAPIKTRKGHIFLVTPSLRDRSVYFSHRCCFRKTSFFPSVVPKCVNFDFLPKLSINKKTRLVDAPSVQSPLPQRRRVPSSSTCGVFPPSSPSAQLSPQTGLRAQQTPLQKPGSERERGGGGDKKSFKAPCSATNEDSKPAGGEMRGRKKCASCPK